MASYWDWLPAVIGAGATIYGASVASKARDRATQQANIATQQSTQAIVDSNREATDASTKAIESAESIMLDQQRSASPGLIGIQNIIGRGEGLTPIQGEGLVDARRRTVDALQGSSLRGSARATSATIRDVEDRLKNSYIDRNRNRADQAASNLSGQYFNAGKNVADLNLRKGQVVSSGLINSGSAVGRGIYEQGQNTAINTQNRATTRGTAIGDITAVITDQMKERNQRDKDSAYRSEKPSEE